MKWSVLLFAAFSLLLTGCLSIAWRGYKKLTEADLETVACMTIGKQNLNARQWQAIREATSEVCTIFADAEFKQRVLSKTWLASCEMHHGRPDTISGDEVYKILMQPIPKFSIHPHQPWHAEAQTETNEVKTAYNRIAISPSEIECWYSSTDTVRSILINTLAHEVVHIASERFLDYDGRALCPDSLLVSYAIGNMAEDVWLKRRGK